MNNLDCCAEQPKGKTTGEKFEGIAFTFCKAATIILLTQKFALPVASGAAAVFYLMAYVSGKTDTRCVMLWPPLIAGFWGLVCIGSSYLLINPDAIHLLNNLGALLPK